MHSLVSALRIPQQVIVPLATEETVLKWFSTNSSVSRKRQNGTRVTDTFVFGKAKLKKKKKKLQLSKTENTVWFLSRNCIKKLQKDPGRMPRIGKDKIDLISCHHRKH